MPRIPIHTPSTPPPPPPHDMLAALKQCYGKVFNVHAGMAHAPVVLAAYTAVRTAIAEHSTFDSAIREDIALVVASADRCGYCQAAHTGAVRKA